MRRFCFIGARSIVAAIIWNNVFAGSTSKIIRLWPLPVWVVYWRTDGT
jgi:hypothetical protein